MTISVITEVAIRTSFRLSPLLLVDCAKAALFFNKRRNLTKTTRSIEEQVIELQASLRSMQKQHSEEMKAHREEMQLREHRHLEKLEKISELLTSQAEARS